MGLTRQSVHVTVRRLVEDGLIELIPNADHRRSPLVDVTKAGREAYSAVDRRQATWVNGLARGIARSDLETTARVLEGMSHRLETGRPGGGSPRTGSGRRKVR
jgi:DNA-binding MarR family transcriptional regulator